MTPTKNLFIASDVRSGSTALGEIVAYTLFKINNLHLWDICKEHFSALDDTSTPEDITAILNTLSVDPLGSVRTSKLMVSSLSVICRYSYIPSIYDEFFGQNTYWIVLTRRNVLRQAISLAFAEQTGLYHEYEARPDSGEHPSMQKIKDCLHSVILSNLYLEMFEHKCRNKLVLEYESFERDPGIPIRWVLENLNLQPDIHESEICTPKLRKTDQSSKQLLEKEFADWLLKNHHHVPNLPKGSA